MKDYDDLWRLSKSNAEVQSHKLIKLAKDRKISLQLDPSWINPDMDRTFPKIISQKMSKIDKIA
jgi:hypothetical protein